MSKPCLGGDSVPSLRPGVDGTVDGPSSSDSIDPIEFRVSHFDISIESTLTSGSSSYPTVSRMSILVREKSSIGSIGIWMSTETTSCGFVESNRVEGFHGLLGPVCSSVGSSGAWSTPFLGFIGATSS